MSNVPISLIQDHIKEYLSKAEYYLVNKSYSYALAFLYRALGLVEVLDNQRYFTKIILKILEIYDELGQSDLVIEGARVALQKPLKPEIEGMIINYQVINLIRKGDFEEAQVILLNMILSSNPLIQRLVNTNLGLLHVFLFKYLKLNTLEKAELYLRKALELSETEGNENACGQVNYYLALLMGEEGLYYNAREQLLLALSQITNYGIRIRIVNELGRVCIKLLDFESADEYLQLARGMAEEIGDLSVKSYNIYYRGLFYLDQLQVELGQSYLLTALYDFLKKDYYLEAASICQTLAQIYEVKSPEKEQHYYQEYRRLISMVAFRSDFYSFDRVCEYAQAE